jgi:rubredoxin
MPEDDRPDPAAALVDASGRPAFERRAEDQQCPRCHASPDRRVRSGGFGIVHDVCGNCGYDFEELTT